MLRNTLLYLSRQQRIFDFIRGNAFARRMASRFVAGETIAVGVRRGGRAERARHHRPRVDLLGESVTNEAEARETGRQYLELLDTISAREARLQRVGEAHRARPGHQRRACAST